MPCRAIETGWRISRTGWIRPFLSNDTYFRRIWRHLPSPTNDADPSWLEGDTAPLLSLRDWGSAVSRWKRSRQSHSIHVETRISTAQRKIHYSLERYRKVLVDACSTKSHATNCASDYNGRAQVEIAMAKKVAIISVRGRSLPPPHQDRADFVQPAFETFQPLLDLIQPGIYLNLPFANGDNRNGHSSEERHETAQYERPNHPRRREATGRFAASAKISFLPAMLFSFRCCLVDPPTVECLPCLNEPVRRDQLVAVAIPLTPRGPWRIAPRVASPNFMIPARLIGTYSGQFGRFSTREIWIQGRSSKNPPTCSGNAACPSRSSPPPPSRISSSARSYSTEGSGSML